MPNSSDHPSRRRVIAGVGAGGLGLLLGGCDRLNRSPTFRSILSLGADANYRSQRVLGRNALAMEFSARDLSPYFRPNGTTMPASPDYQRHLASGFANWRLTIDGLVTRPLNVSLDQLRSLPQRTQITRHDCVEGWSAIGQWTGPQLSHLLHAAGLRDQARYIVFHCADEIGGVPYYESIDLDDAFHPQTILAHRLNGRDLPVMNGAPLRLRVERQLGYKHAKYVMRIEARSRLDDLFGGKGGMWEDSTGYQWYAGT
jgi:DMSO/TMAO reductase YedYZ molybdopterin-dependent catalytic subunit